MKQIELIGKRKLREKHFLQENGIIVANVYDEDVHFLKNDIYEEIDNTLLDKGNYYINKNNKYNVKFAKNSKKFLARISIKDNYIESSLAKCNTSILKENITKTKLHKNVCYSDVLKNIDIEYNIMPSKVKEAIILRNKDVNLDDLIFNIKTNMLLEQNQKGILAKIDGETIFEFEQLYMVDSNFSTSNDVRYELKNIDIGIYELKIIVDKQWLLDEKRNYPVIIDPTITNSSSNNLYDTYIANTSNYENTNFGTDAFLNVGLWEIDDNSYATSRSLIKFELPTIGTGDQIVHAELSLIGYPINGYPMLTQIVDIHRVTQDWNESTATWNTMNDKYDSKIEGYFYGVRSGLDISTGIIDPAVCGADLTRLVKKWYTGTPNYGIMLKLNEEVYEEIRPMFFSKNNGLVGTDPKPILSISYRNTNGIEDYIDAENQKLSIGRTYINDYTGNLTCIFDIGKTIGGKFPADLSLIYNTNDVVLGKNIGYGLGYKLNFHQTIKEREIDGTTYLEYEDSDGTIHYLINQQTEITNSGYNIINTNNVYYDEDGLNIEVVKNTTDYVLKDKNENKMKFIVNGNVAYLSEIEDVNGDNITLRYDSNDRITKVIDANNSEISIVYNSNGVEIISPYETVYLSYINNQITNINCLLGDMHINYSNNLIDSITDVNGIKILYEYYSQTPYKIQKVKECGNNNTIGEYYELIYGYDSTTIIDSKGNARNIIFNSQGGITSICGQKQIDSLQNAYGLSQINGVDSTYNGENNKLLKSMIPIKYVKNLLTNTSFEESLIIFTPSTDASILITNECSVTGSNSLKVISNSSNQYIQHTINVPKGEKYTFSGYVKNNNDINFTLSYIDSNNTIVEENSEIIHQNNDFERYDVTIDYPSTATSDLTIKIFMTGNDVLYLDDIQLENSEVANNYNIIENSDFSEGYTDWSITAESEDGNPVSISDKLQLITLLDGTAALKIKKNPSYNLNMTKTFNISGDAGDNYNISFWYKNNGIHSNLTPYFGSRVFVIFNYTDQEDGYCILPTPEFNINDEAWQFMSNDFKAEKPYNSITVSFSHEADANDVYLTNLSLFKDIRSTEYEYDSNGNIITKNNLDNTIDRFNYDNNNQLIKIANPKGKNFVFEYDNVVTDRVINGISEMGISNKIKYDENENPVQTQIVKNNVNGELFDGLYRLRLKGMEKYLGNISGDLVIKTDNCGHDLWNIKKAGDYYKIYHSIILDNYLTVQNNVPILSIEDGDNSLFEISKNDNGSYSIKSKTLQKNLKYNDTTIVFDDKVENDYHFEFYIETADYDIFIENDATYSTDNKFIGSVTNTLLGTTNYNYNSITGLLTSVTNPKGITTNYYYDQKNRKSSILNNNINIQYNYNNNGVLSQMIQGDRIYTFTYDEFNNIIQNKINNNILSNFTYENNNGNLSNITYGNGHVIEYLYDDFNRLKSKMKYNSTYEYKYDSNGNLVKIKSPTTCKKFKYDLSKKISSFQFDNFKIKYKYDANNNVINKNYKRGNIEKNIIYTYNEDDSIVNINYDNNYNIVYTRDNLGRLINTSIDNGIITNYEYMSNGKRSSLMVKKMQLPNNKLYKYRYDKIGNITHIYINDNLVSKYNYDEYNQLIMEKDYLANRLTKYKYDELGNILSVVNYNMSDLKFISKNQYYYSNLNWKDLLTSYNDISISYDNIGNPTSIGQNITLTWQNGIELKSYNDTNNNTNIQFTYDSDGLRTSKIVNNIITDYKYEGKNLIFEDRNNTTIYYIYDDNSLIGFEYNNNIFYYLKNLQEDIVGILNSNCQVVAKYSYDSWGNILSITDENDIDISNNQNHVANINSFRYRSYYYDKETGLYYISSRYYNPNWKRFLNVDGIIGMNGDILSNNLFAYCSNNPISNYDLNGKFKISSLVKKIKKAVNKVVEKYKNSISMFKYSFSSKGIKKEYNKNSSVSKSIINSSQFQDKISYIGSQYNTSTGKINYSHDSVSLYGSGNKYEIDNSYSLGNVEFDVKFTRIETKKMDGMLFSKFKVEGVVYDYYNFDYFYLPTSKGNALNDLGYILEKSRIIEPYNWYADIEYYTDWIPIIN